MKGLLGISLIIGMKELKYSRQREALLECIKMRHDHPTADTLFHALRVEDPKISLGTVYRNLNLLTELGFIRKISCGDGIERYDYKMGEHYHFVCRECGKVIDVSPKQIVGIEEGVHEEEIGMIENHSLIFYGKCKTCYK